MALTRRNFLMLTAAAATGIPRCAAMAETAPRPINLLLILTDNQGAWTLGCYGNPDIRTPNIDRLAAEGVRFTRAFSCNAVCSPTRASLLTGLIPSQHGVHTYLTAGGAQIGPKAYCTVAEFPTLPKILSRAGYTCGLVGKWHLGGNLTPQEGFSYWITMPHGHTTTFYDAEIIENGRVRREPEYLTDFWTRHAVRFLEQNRDRPFFLYLAYNGPYG
ncbi:MAG: sulfatase-like hydrolase/transferase, partial [Candidatus Sumerlaeia bacterium]|nr:sulfatase-like hydrolase/transferase [Candidatus Sumerlaeia bacterium]